MSNIFSRHEVFKLLQALIATLMFYILYLVYNETQQLHETLTVLQQEVASLRSENQRLTNLLSEKDSVMADLANSYGVSAGVTGPQNAFLFKVLGLTVVVALVLYTINVVSPGVIAYAFTSDTLVPNTSIKKPDVYGYINEESNTIWLMKIMDDKCVELKVRLANDYLGSFIPIPRFLRSVQDGLDLGMKPPLSTFTEQGSLTQIVTQSPVSTQNVIDLSEKAANFL